MYNIIGNSCISSWITAKILKQQFINPFCWCIMDFNSCLNLIQNFYDINFADIELQYNDNNNEFSVIIANLVRVQYVHYKFDLMANDIITDGPDVRYNQIWEYIISKYIERTKRMIQNKIEPIFMFAGAGKAENKRSTFNIEEQHIINEINTPFKIYVSFGEMIKFTNSKIIPLYQTYPYKGNTIQMANALYAQIHDL